ncbi:MAG: AAA domain-containing protein [Acutalibacteraceae bacterium]|jgi:very-short-patch-repair endonuclease
MKECSETIVPIRDQLLKSFNPEITREIDGKDLYTKLTGQFGSFLSRMFSGDYKTLMAELQVYLKDSGKLKYQQAVALADQLVKLQSATKSFEENESRIPGCVGPCYKGPDTDWTHVLSSLDILKGFFSEETRSFGLISKMSLERFTEHQILFKADSDLLSSEVVAIEEAKARIEAQFSQDALNLEKNSYSYCIRKLEGCLKDFEKLGNWISFMSLLKQLNDTDLSDFVDLVIEQINLDKITGAFRKVFYKQWIENIIFSVPELASFSRIKQDQAVQSFIKKDGLQYEISKIQIRSELSQQRPNLNMVAGGSAVAILRREGNKKRKQMPIRKLLSETGSLVQIIKPCFLMSPLSVSTFLDPEKISFDTVVFDEASQIFPQDAVGSIYRGKQLIVVGDSKQMPPSNFFNTSMDIDDDDEEIGDINDFESILDVCSAVFTTERLAWHYRSHYEQLIAFSNLYFYNNHLVTFPSSSKDHKGIGVDYYYVNGVFDRKSKTNKAEAHFIVDLIYRNIEEYPQRSLGVVAFSVAQQNMIDKLLSKRREADPSYEWFFKSDNVEPFFIKNLETVQGDERDTIIFSVAYAKDSQGRFIQNFGPLNREGGERRLNVAVTRAKDNVQLVASIHYTDINLSTSGSEGVRLLRAYLDYAQNGDEALERAITVSGEDKFDSYFEQEVCDFLRNNGFTVDTQVGCSGYRIDLGLRRPDSSNYLMAIECDGATYHNSKNARDRDSLRQRVLENMGWQFYRIWSTDWYRNKAVERERLLQAATEAVSKANKPQNPATKKMPQNASTVTQEVQDRFVTEVKEAKCTFPKYRQLDAMQIVRKHQFSLQSAIHEILETEAPLSEEFLLKRIVWLFGREKVTKVVTDDYNRKMYGCGRIGIIRKNGFLYLQEMNTVTFRVPGDRREIKYISVEELADGLHMLITQNVTATRDGLYKTMTNLLGFNRTGEAITNRFDKALALLLKSQKVKEDQGVLTCLVNHLPIKADP